MARALVKIQHTSMQFSDTKVQHEKDAAKVFDRAEAKGVWLMSGTEAGGSRNNHSLRDALIAEAKEHGFYINAHKDGEWVAMNRKFLTDFRKGFAGPFIKGTTGKSPAQGAHGARGIAWASAVAKDYKIGRVTIGAAHYLTNRSEQVSGSNDRLVNGIGAWAKRHGKGNGIVFLGADTNTNDKARDVFNGKPMTSISDELKKWPPTLGTNTWIDVIASYDHDGRVKGMSYNVLNDKEFPLYTDHYLLDAVYSVQERAAQK